MSSDWRKDEFGDAPRTAAEAWENGDNEREWRSVYLVGAAFAAGLERDLAARDRELQIAKAKTRGSLANNLCPDHRDKQQGKPCLACEIERRDRELFDLRAGLGALADLWVTQQAEYPDSPEGQHAAAVLRLCASELRDAARGVASGQGSENG